MTRIFVEDNELDVDAGFSNLITYAIDDMNNLDSKSTAFTKTIIIPGTAKNNRLFGNIFEIANSNFTSDSGPNILYNFNAARAVRCRVEVNGLQVIKGILRLMGIIIDGHIEYECAIFGELGGFITNLGNKKIEELDFSHYNHVYNLTNIVNSWDGSRRTAQSTVQFFAPHSCDIYLGVREFKVGDTMTFAPLVTLNPGPFTIASVSGDDLSCTVVFEETVVDEGPVAADYAIIHREGTGYYYPLIDYGHVSTNKHDYQYTALRPALFLREFMDKIITGNGYTWESNFFDTAYFKRIIIPNNNKSLEKYSVTNYITALFDSASEGYSQPNTTGVGGTISPPYPRYLTHPTFVSVNNFTSLFSGEFFRHDGAAVINVKAKLIVRGVVNFHITQTPVNTIEIVVLRSGADVGSATQSIDMPTQAQGQLPFDISMELVSNMEPNDLIAIRVNGGTGYNQRVLRVDYSSLIVDKEPPGFIEMLPGDDLDMNTNLPKGIYQRDWFVSILKMFYLMVTEDKYRQKHLIIEPWVDFFNTDSSTFLNWSNKIDRSNPITIKPMSELTARYYQLKFKKDNDYYNENYSKKYNQGYGDYIYDSAYNFAKDTETVEIIFAATPLYAADGEDKVTPVIFKKSGTTEETMDHVVRIMQKKKVTGVSSWDILNIAAVLGSYTDYPYAGHFDDPDAPDNDLNFGAVRELYFVLASGNLSNTVGNIFYSPYLAEITDKDSRLLTAKFKLTLSDIYNLDFSKLVYIDGALFRVQNIIDFDAGNDELTKVELLRVINLIY